jgi:hypothetical protein
MNPFAVRRFWRGTLIAAVAVALIMAAAVAHAATPINTCGTTITNPGSYLVTKNLTPKKGATSACIGIESPLVTIDLGGFTIDCGCSATPQSCQDGIALRGHPFVGIIVRNGHVTDCERGLFLPGPGVLIDQVEALSNSSDAILLDRGSLVAHSIVDDNGGVGISNICPSVVVDSTIVDNFSGNIAGGCNIWNDLAP